MAQREAVFPAGRHDLYTSQTYSAAIRSGDLLFVSGQVGSRSDGSLATRQDLCQRRGSHSTLRPTPT